MLGLKEGEKKDIAAAAAAGDDDASHRQDQLARCSLGRAASESECVAVVAPPLVTCSVLAGIGEMAPQVVRFAPVEQLQKKPIVSIGHSADKRYCTCRHYLQASSHMQRRRREQ